MNNYDELFNILFTKTYMYRDDPPFTLVSGKQSNYYFDCKASTLDAKGVYLTGAVLFETVKGIIEAEKIQALGGLTLGADPIAISTAIYSQTQGISINPLVIRKEAKAHGTQKWIEGNLDNVKNVLAIDDVITTGKSTITAIERLQESGLQVSHAAVIIDREEGGRENIEKLGIKVISLYTRSDFDNKRLSLE